jgi:hypothetical protein
MSDDPKLNYGDPAASTPHAGRSIGTWLILLLVWLIGLVVWVIYLVAILYALFKLL